MKNAIISGFLVVGCMGPALGALGAVGVGLAASACTQQQASDVANAFGQVGLTILNDVIAGKTLPEIITDVGSLAGMVGKDIAAIVNAVLAALLAGGYVPPSAMPHAQQVLSQLAQSLAARAK
jgi:hypothetical protein